MVYDLLLMPIKYSQIDLFKCKQ